MKITVFNGSPRGKNSNCNIIVQSFLSGAKEAGAQVENIFLIEKDIAHCMGCFSCWFNTPGKCIQNDDMTELLNKYKSSDIVCYATPIYGWTMTACLKNFIDRLIPINSPTVVEVEGNFDMEKTNKNPEIVMISNAGFPGNNNFDSLKETAKHANPILEIYRNCGMILKSKEDFIKDKVAVYLSYVKRAGTELVQNGTVSDEVIEGLNMEILSIQEYVKLISK